MTFTNHQLPTLNHELKSINSDLETKLVVLETKLEMMQNAERKHKRLLSQNHRLRLLIRKACQNSFQIATTQLLSWLERCGLKIDAKKTEKE